MHALPYVAWGSMLFLARNPPPTHKTKCAHRQRKPQTPAAHKSEERPSKALDHSYDHLDPSVPELCGRLLLLLIAALCLPAAAAPAPKPPTGACVGVTFSSLPPADELAILSRLGLVAALVLGKRLFVDDPAALPHAAIPRPLVEPELLSRLLGLYDGARAAERGASSNAALSKNPLAPIPDVLTCGELGIAIGMLWLLNSDGGGGVMVEELDLRIDGRILAPSMLRLILASADLIRSLAISLARSAWSWSAMRAMAS